MTHILFYLPYASANTRKEAEENTYSLFFFIYRILFKLAFDRTAKKQT
jgi:hypothetical protein